MGKVSVQIKLTNQGDLVAVQRKLSKSKPRVVRAEALVDTGATRLYLKPSLIRALGLQKVDGVISQTTFMFVLSKGKPKTLQKVDGVISQTTNGPKKRSVYEPVRLEVQGRHGDFNVVDVGESLPNLLGQIPLEYLDFVVDPKNRKLIPNPEHGDKQMSEED